MHGPQLREEILTLMLRLDSSPPEDCIVIQKLLDEHYCNLQLITKEPMRKLKVAIAKQYPEWVAEFYSRQINPNKNPAN